MNEKVKVFNQVANVYDDWYEHPQGKQVFLAERDAVNYMLPSKGVGLEVGLGTGAFASSLENEDRPIICLDPSTEMISKAKEKNLHNVLGYGHKPPFRRVFDFSYMVTVIEFVVNPVETLKGIKDVCKMKAPYTLLFINSESSWGDLYRDIGSKGDPVFSQARLYSLDEITKILEESCYQVVDSKGTLSSPPMSSEVDARIIEVNNKVGVIIVKATPSIN